jgi:hypothetical protein
MSRKQIKLVTEINSDDHSSALVTFDFLDASDGGIVEIIHQGTKGAEFRGTLRGTRIASNGSVQLDMDALAAITEKPLPHRARIFLTNYSSLFGAFLFMAIVIGFLWVVDFSRLFGPPGPLVNPNNYNLHTVEGQTRFVDAVKATGYYNQESKYAFQGALMAILAFAAIGLCYTLYRHAKKKFPPEIALYRDSTTSTRIVESSSTDSEQNVVNVDVASGSSH